MRPQDTSSQSRQSGVSRIPAFVYFVALALTFSVAVACSGDSEPTATSVPTAAPAPTATIVKQAPTPTPELTSPADAEEEDVVEKIEGDEALATVFGEWGPTCLNGVYPPQAPQLDDVDVADFSTDANGLEFYTFVEGYGDKPKLDWEVDVQYTGWLEDGCIFDSSYTRSEPSVFPVGAVIPGWQMAITQMQLGERRRVVIPSELAYGEAGSPPIIPANATLTFDIILVDGSDPDAQQAVATQEAERLLTLATAEALDEPVEFAPILEDYLVDASRFLGALPQGEVTCMGAYAGGADALLAIFSSQDSRPTVRLVEQFDECLSDNSLRNVVVGRIVIINPQMSESTVSCMADTIENPTLKPLFGVFNELEVSREWTSAHFCMTAEERIAFETALYTDPAQRPAIGNGTTFVDVQECMVNRLGSDRYFAPVQQPDTSDRAAMDVFFSDFTAFMIADIACRQGDAGFVMEDGTFLTEEAATCVAEELGDVRFGEVLLDRVWVPTNDQHVEIVEGFSKCDVANDFLDLPASVSTLGSSDLSCLLTELENTEDRTRTSLRSFAEVGSRGELKSGDLAALLFGTHRCGIELPGVPRDTELSDTEVMCIVGKIDAELFAQGRAAVMPAFDAVLVEAGDCVEG